MQLGATNQLVITVQRPYDRIVSFSSADINEDIPMWRTLSEDDWQRAGQTWVKNIEFAVYDTGQFVLPALVALVDGDGRIDTLTSNILPLTVTHESQVQLSEIDIRPIIVEKMKWTDAAWPIGALLLLAGLVWLIVKLIKKRAADPDQIQEIVIPSRPADEIAREELATLRSLALWKEGGFKEHQTRLSMIIRRYLQGQFGLQAPESTTSQILQDLTSINLRSDQQSSLRELLQLADMVKYAKAEPPLDSHERLLASAERFVEETVQTSVYQSGTDIQEEEE